MPTPERRPLYLAFVLALLFGGSAMANPAVTTSNAWVRLLPGNLPLAGYVALHNHTKKPIHVIKITSPSFKRIEMHHSMAMGGMDKMVAIKTVTIPAQDTFKFSPGGYHLMMWRNGKLQLGDHVQITFTLDNGKTLTTTFVVKRAP